MAGYDDLDSLVGKLKRSAIDAYMHDAGFTVGATFYASNISAVPAQDGEVTRTEMVTRPGGDGEGGGDSTVSAGTLVIEDKGAWADSFGEVRSAVDTLVDRWRDLPDPEQIAEVVAFCRQTTFALAGTASTEGGIATGVGDIASYLKLMDQNLGELSGQTVDAFKTKFVGKLGETVAGLWAISMVRGAAVAAQQGLWDAARGDVVDILAGARKSLDAVAASGTKNWEVALKVAGFAVKGASLFAAAGGPAASAAVGATGLAIEILADTTTGTPLRPDVDSYKNIMTGLKKALDALSDQIETEERLLSDNMIENMQWMDSKKSAYDLTVPDISADGSDDIIVWKRELVDEITRTQLPGIAESLTAASHDTFQCLTGNAVTRDDSIGMGQVGPSKSIADISWVHFSLLKDLAFEVSNGAKLLQLTLNEFEYHENANASELAQVESELDRGSGYKPWDRIAEAT
jgi:hypothetical protein